MDTRPKQVVQLQIMPKNTFDTILTIAEKHDAANHVTGVYQHLRNKQAAFNATAQVKPKQKSVPTQTSNFGHAQNSQHQNNQQQ
jgi:hypothetical protein